MLCVGRHAVTGRVNDRDALGPCLIQDLIQPRHKLFEPADSVAAVMIVPDIADDDRRFFRLPLLLSSELMKASTVKAGFLLILQPQHEVFSAKRRNGNEAGEENRKVGKSHDDSLNDHEEPSVCGSPAHSASNRRCSTAHDGPA